MKIIQAGSTVYIVFKNECGIILSVEKITSTVQPNFNEIIANAEKKYKSFPQERFFILGDKAGNYFSYVRGNNVEISEEKISSVYTF